MKLYSRHLGDNFLMIKSLAHFYIACTNQIWRLLSIRIRCFLLSFRNIGTFISFKSFHLVISLSLFSFHLVLNLFQRWYVLIKTLHVPKHLLNWSIAFVQINYKHDLYSTHDFVWYGYKGLTRFQMMFSNKNRKHFCYSNLIKINYFVGQSLCATALN